MRAPCTSRRSCCTCVPACARSSCRGSQRPTRTSFLVTSRCTERRTDRRATGTRSAMLSAISFVNSGARDRRRSARAGGERRNALAERRPNSSSSFERVASRCSAVVLDASATLMSMRGMDRLLDLQATDSSMDRLEHRRGQLEAGEDLAIARKQMEDAESRLGELRLALDSVAAQSSRFEHDIDSMGRKLDDEQKRMYDGSIANAKELEALQHEITNLKERRSRAEDELLELMVRRDDMDARASKETEEVAATRARVDEVGGDAARELDDIAGTSTNCARRARRSPVR